MMIREEETRVCIDGSLVMSVKAKERREPMTRLSSGDLEQTRFAS